jgi:raffinose/stachyose/melibiose transport system substrate-binding protein
MKKRIVLLFAALFISLVTAQATVTLRVWDTFTDAAEDTGMNALIEAFEAANPNIQIERDVQDVESMRPIIQTSLASGTGPDVFYFDTGPGFAGVLANAGLLLPLDDAYASQGWNDYIYPWTKERTTFDGKVYGIGNEIEFYGVYYNQDLFNELGLQAPTTYEEFLAVCAALLEAGKIPVAFANSGGWPAYHLFSVYANNETGDEKMEELLFGDGSWEDPAIVQAIQRFFVDMNGAGYLIPNTNAVTYDDAINLFASGMAGMHMSGTWAMNSIMEKANFETGWFFLPNPNGGDPLPPAGLGSGYFISSATEHPEEAIAFLDFLYDPANARIWTEGMRVIPPYEVDTSGYDVPQLYTFALEALATVPMGYNIDVLTPDTFNTMMADGFQAVFLGQKTPEQQAADLQAAMQAYRDDQ